MYLTNLLVIKKNLKVFWNNLTMVRCSIIKCKSDSDQKIPRLTFHSFPVNPDIRKKWIKASGRNDWVPKRSSKICCLHFDTNDILKKGRYTYIHPDAFPVTKLGGTEERNEPMPCRSASITFTETMEEQPMAVEFDAVTVPCETSPDILPRILRRKWKIEKKRSAERLKKLRTIQEKCRRLTRKVANLENIILELKYYILANSSTASK